MIEPVIETARLRLRLHRPGDLPDHGAMRMEPETMRHVGGIAADAQAAREDSWARILRYVGHWALFGWGLFAVEEKASAAFIGEVGIADFHRAIGAGFDAAPEAAWMLRRSATGRGYATEALRAAIDWHLANKAREPILAIVDPLNSGSIRVAGKLGFVQVETRLYHGAPKLLFERRS